MARVGLPMRLVEGDGHSQAMRGFDRCLAMEPITASDPLAATATTMGTSRLQTAASLRWMVGTSRSGIGSSLAQYKPGQPITARRLLMVGRVCGGGGVGGPSPQIGLDQRLRSPWPFFARMEQEWADAMLAFHSRRNRRRSQICPVAESENARMEQFNIPQNPEKAKSNIKKNSKKQKKYNK